jgi:hypothetical protein
LATNIHRELYIGNLLAASGCPELARSIGEVRKKMRNQKEIAKIVLAEAQGF